MSHCIILSQVELVIQKFSQASLALQKGVLCEDSAAQQTAQAITRQAVDNAGKYLTNALESWGSNVSRLFTVHLTYILPFFQPSHLSVIARSVSSQAVKSSFCPFFFVLLSLLSLSYIHAWCLRGLGLDLFKCF